MTSTRSLTETRLTVARPPDGGRVRIGYSASGAPHHPVIRPFVLASDDVTACVALVPEGALLLAGDAVSVTIEVGPGATLRLSEPAGTVAYDMRGASASWDVNVSLGLGSRLVWSGEPFVAAAGSDTTRTTRVSVDFGARFALRETVVLGRHGEQPGRLRHEVYVEHTDGRPLLADGVDLGPGRNAISLGGHRVMGSVLVVGGCRPGAELPGTHFSLEGDGTLVRELVDQAHLSVNAATWRAAVGAVLDD